MINCVTFSTFLLFFQLCHIVCAKQRCDESVQGAKRRKFHPQSYGWVTAPNIKCEVRNLLKISSQLLIFGENKVREQLADDRPLRPPDMNIHKYRFSIFHNWQIRNLPFVHSPDKLAKYAEFEKSLISSPVAAFPRSELRLVEGRESKRDDVTSIMTLKEHIHIVDTHMGQILQDGKNGCFSSLFSQK